MIGVSEMNVYILKDYKVQTWIFSLFKLLQL
jgi:hypothetical protein